MSNYYVLGYRNISGTNPKIIKISPIHGEQGP